MLDVMVSKGGKRRLWFVCLKICGSCLDLGDGGIRRVKSFNRRVEQTKLATTKGAPFSLKTSTYLETPSKTAIPQNTPRNDQNARITFPTSGLRLSLRRYPRKCEMGLGRA